MNYRHLLSILDHHNQVKLLNSQVALAPKDIFSYNHVFKFDFVRLIELHVIPKGTEPIICAPPNARHCYNSYFLRMVNYKMTTLRQADFLARTGDIYRVNDFVLKLLIPDAE